MPARLCADHGRIFRRLREAGATGLMGKTLELIARDEAERKFPIELSRIRFAQHAQALPTDPAETDCAFLQDMLTDPPSAAIIAGVASIDHGMGLQMIAEGIETAEQQIMVRALGCDEGQGYSYGGPMAAAAFARWLQQDAPPVAVAC